MSDEPISIRQLKVFVALAEQGYFTRAAAFLGLSQSTVSSHIADLERRLDTRLVERARAGIRLTAAGQALLRPAREVLLAEHNARMAVEELAGLLRGTLSIGGSTIPSCYLLPDILARFHAGYPGVSLKLVTGDSREIVDRVRDAEVEVGIVGSDPGGGDLHSRVVGEDRLVLVFAPGHPFARKKSVPVAEVVEHPLVMREEGSGTRAATEEGLGSRKLEVACQVGSTESLKATVRAGLGVAFVSSLAVSDELEAGTLATTRVEGFDVGRSFYLVSRPQKLISHAARAFCTIAAGR